MNTEKYLPIGSVVLLQNATKRIMIIGYNADEKNKKYDYVGCVYPEGLVTLKTKLLFNHSQIHQVYFVGLMDNEWKELLPKLITNTEKFPTNTQDESLPKSFVDNNHINPSFDNTKINNLFN